MALGCLSLYLYYDGISQYLYQLSHPEIHHSFDADMSSTWKGVSGIFLRPFLTFGIVGLWCYAIDTRRHATRILSATMFTVVALPLIILGSASFNRASMLVPLLGVITVFSNRIRRLSSGVFIAIVGVLLLLAAAWGTYRSSATALEDFNLQDQLGTAPIRLQAEFSEILITATALDSSPTSAAAG
jgi:hypothetical protein